MQPLSHADNREGREMFRNEAFILEQRRIKVSERIIGISQNRKASNLAIPILAL